MNYCAEIVNNVCVAVVVGDFEWVNSQLPGKWIDLGNGPLTVGPGDIYNPKTKTFTTPTTEVDNG